MAALAAAVIAVLGVGALMGARLADRSTVGPATKPNPTSNAALADYRAVVDRDYRAIRSDTPGATVCSPRGSCIATNLKLKSAIETLIRDIDSTPIPPPLVAATANLKQAAQQYVQGLDTTINAMKDPSIDYTQVSTPTALELNLDLAVATIDCWPAQPLPTSNYIGPNGYGCATGPS